MSAHILEIKAVLVRGDSPVAYGVDDLGRGFAIALDRGLAAEVATALDNGRTPIVAVESGLPIPPASGRSPGMAKRPVPRANDYDLESLEFDGLVHHIEGTIQVR